MADKKQVVDDYYSSISHTGDKSEEGDSGKKKIKLKSKPGTLVNETKEETIVGSEELLSCEETHKKIKIKKPTSSFVEKVKFEEKEEKKEEFDEIEEKKVYDDEKEKEFNDSEKEDSDVVPERKVFKFTSAENQKSDFVKRDGFSKEDHKPQNLKKKKTFSQQEEVTDGGEKNWKKKKKGTFVDFKRKNINDLIEGKDENVFIRSSKVNKKKEEKKAEDIVQNLVSHSGETIVIGDVLSVKELSEKLGIPLTKLIAEFMKNGMLVNINSKIDFDSASIIAEIFDIKLEKDNSSGISVQDLLHGNILEMLKEEDSSKLEERPPVISIMGHVDHGKTSLLDYIRNAKVVQGEAGGITQSIGAYQVVHNEKRITFLDTPGHEAFTVMRARGAKSTDIAILVVAADEGVKPQTIESINHAKEAGIPVVVAINKMDKEGANPDFVKNQLSENGLIPEDWGGDTPMIPVSAKTGFGIDTLLEIILLVAEMKNLKANPTRLGVATVIESHLDNKLGPVATILVNTGTINQGDNIVCKDTYGKIKILKDYAHKNIKTSAPGDPVLVIGLEKVVEGGDILQVLPSIEQARQRAIEYKDILAHVKSKSISSLDNIMSKIKAGNLKQLKLLIKADTNGSLEAIKGSLIKLSTEETTVTIIHSGVGNITESDIAMCQGSSAILIGFRVSVIQNAKNLIQELGVELISSEVIYHITEKIEKIVTGMLDTKEVEIILGQAVVGGIFYNSKDFMIIGLKLKDESIIEKKAKIRIIKGDKILGYGEVSSLKQGVEEINKFEGPGECGIKYVGNHKPEMGDMLEFYKISSK
ncbi:translation initiation factor IF-2 [Candidatus Gracilibacteria bacterium]|nr:translation initiation factor IF-2 [Candidatus Gracilibacteria bacterium]NUJ98763.1 translation initiation factor IF-2 [Candidatus Gracilibacteria bacterium]